MFCPAAAFGPFLRLGLNAMKKSLGRSIVAFEASMGTPNGL
jgi:hypothetical protein